MVEKPPITWYGCHALNVLPKPAGIVPEAIVIHTTGGQNTAEDLARWFGGLNIQQGLRGSTHYGVGRDGGIGAYVEVTGNLAPIANGAYDNATAKLVHDNAGINANYWTVSIEHLDNAVPGSVTEIQLARSAWLCAWIWETYIQPYAAKTGATLDLDHLLQHKEFDPSGKPFCASWPLARMQAHLAKMAALLNPPKPTPTPEPEPVPPAPVPVTDWEIKYGQLDREVEQWLADDMVGAEMRRQRLAELRMWTP
jgi:hypothetical protein